MRTRRIRVDRVGKGSSEVIPQVTRGESWENGVARFGGHRTGVVWSGTHDGFVTLGVSIAPTLFGGGGD
jgi:hypothetical protein